MAENRLGKESSPYLRQHARNPVNWYPWGEEALALARREDRPIFLSVGYSACHWCHVMAHESFEDREVAAVLNTRFVPVKVDREERPDLDTLYMRSVLLMNGHGGWPLSVFLTPDLRPFFGGTYFPKESRFGMTGFREVLLAVDRAYRERRGDLQESAARLTRALAQSFRPTAGGGVPGPSDADAARRALLSRFDGTEGGFGAGTKFPQPPLLHFLLDESRRLHDPALADQVYFTLRKMEAGGVRDQVGGGFHRYSVDARWHVPHYEKMLYDNAQLASLYFRAGTLSGEAQFLRVGQEILGDLRRSMAAPGGGFVAALDADSEGEEGRFYLWTRRQLETLLGPDDGATVAVLYGITADNADLETGTLHRQLLWSEAAAALGEEEEAFRSRVARLLERMRADRDARVRPGVDTKVLCDWNALAASAFLDGFAATGEGALLDVGLETLGRMWERCWDGGVLHHLWDGERARVEGFLADYAYLAQASWKAFLATGEPVHWERAALLSRAALVRFRDGSGHLFSTPPGATSDLLLPVRDEDDGVLPSPISVMGQVLWDLERATGDLAWREALDGLLAAEAGSLGQSLGAQPLLAGLAARRAGPTVEIVVAAPDPDTAARLLAETRRAAASGALVLPYFSDRFPEAQAERLPLLKGRRREEGSAAFVCTGGACRLPVNTADQLAELLRHDPLSLFAAAPEN